MKKRYLFLSIFFSIYANAGIIENVKVTEHKEITKKFVTKIKTGETCWEEFKIEKVPCGGEPQVDKNSIGLDTLIGTTIGVIAGNQVGKGNGKVAAKVVGGLTGGYIANQTRGGSQTMCETKVPYTKCEDNFKYVEENKVIAYDNCIRHYGQKICKQTPNKLHSLKVETTIRVY